MSSLFLYINFEGLKENLDIMKICVVFSRELMHDRCATEPGTAKFDDRHLSMVVGCGSLTGHDVMRRLS